MSAPMRPVGAVGASTIRHADNGVRDAARFGIDMGPRATIEA